MKFDAATAADAPDVAALRNATADQLTARHGRGWWSGHCTEKGVLADLRHARVFVARDRGRIVGTLRLGTRKPWAIDLRHFTPGARPLFLSSMAVAPARQHRGVGRFCLAAAETVARRLGADAILLDAFDHVAGAGDFYRKCGYRETARALYRAVPLIYFERLLRAAA
jgi:GNAT superfamily N-acetyltransferase